MKKFEIIEEGRLSKSEMNQVQGGVKTCLGGEYTVSPCAPNSSYSTCGVVLYLSCVNQFFACTLGYKGPTGPGGIVKPEPTLPGTPIKPITEVPGIGFKP